MTRLDNNEAMRKKLKFAIHRLQTGRSRVVAGKPAKLNISTVAKEAGITPATIHNVYPDIAETIRTLMGKSSRAQRDGKNEELSKARESNRELRAEVALLNRQIIELASENGRLVCELAELKVIAASRNVIPIRE